MRHELRARWWVGLAHFVVLQVLLVPAILMWPRFAERVGALRGFLPIQKIDDLLTAIEREGEVPYVLVQHFVKGCNLVGSLVAVFLAMTVVAAEAHRGTLELWLARPLSRTRLLAQRWLTGALLLIVPLFLSTATIPRLCDLVYADLQYGPLFVCAMHQALFLLFVFSVTFFFSCLSSNAWMVGLIMALAVILNFALYVVEGLTDWSLMRWSDLTVYQALYDHGRFDPWIVGALLGITLAAWFGSLYAFARRVP